MFSHCYCLNYVIPARAPPHLGDKVNVKAAGITITTAANKTIRATAAAGGRRRQLNAFSGALLTSGSFTMMASGSV